MRPMTALAPVEADADPRRVPVDVEIVVPVYNEAAQLAERITALRTFLDQSFPFRALVTIVDNASTDDTFAGGERAGDHRRRAWPPCTCPARGGATRSALGVVDQRGPRRRLHGRRPLHLVVGAAPPRGAAAVRAPGRDDRVAPRPRRARRARAQARAHLACLQPLLKLTLRGRFSDAQCGFKALRRDAAEKLLPLVEDNEWFFDTELLVTAERLGLRIGEVPVDWVDDPDSRVDIVSTAADDLRGVWRMLVRRPKGLRRIRSNEVAADQLLRFAGVGVISTLGYLFLFVAWRPLIGALAANAVAMAIATLFNTAVHRELSRTTDGQARRGRLYAVAGGLYAVSLAFTTFGLVVAQWVAPGALLPELVAITVANLAAAVFRFAVLRAWIFRPCARPGAEPMEMSR